MKQTMVNLKVVQEITAIITNYNGRSILENCLPETHAILVANGIHEIILADDCSTDDSLDYVSKNFPDIIISKTTQNSRFSINCNTAAKKATGDILFFLNNDMIPKKLDIESVRHIFKNSPNLFSCSPKIDLYENITLINQGICNGFFKDGWFHVISDRPAVNQLDENQSFPIL
ncbi:glycosyltransferase [Candidatus Marinamargulisbacteria bacterium]|jgi:GT2 family glycosyltransferase|nr:glycosyltransferase [Candidatus Marinamargulisbacteria bacterium]